MGLCGEMERWEGGRELDDGGGGDGDRQTGRQTNEIVCRDGEEQCVCMCVYRYR